MKNVYGYLGHFIVKNYSLLPCMPFKPLQASSLLPHAQPEYEMEHHAPDTYCFVPGLINVSCSGCKKMIGWNPSGCIGVYIRRYGIRVLKEHSWSLPLVCSRSPFLMESLLLLSKSNWSYAIHFSTHLYGWISLTDLDQWIIKRELIFERILASICSSTLRKASPSLQFDSA